MKETLEFVLRHGYSILFLSVFVEQIGLPIPAGPVLLAMGALAGMGKMQFLPALLLALVASLVSDLIWYWMGRRRGSAILQLLCRISLEPDSCVRRTENVFVKYGARSLLFSKFVPGLSTAAPPLAGMFHMKLWRFILFDGLGALIWAGGYSLLGLLFREQLEDLAQAALGMGTWLLVAIAVTLAGYIGWKFFERRRFYRELRIARITPEELDRMIQRGEKVAVVDLRNSLEWEDGADKIPGALHFDFEELESRHEEIPRDRDVVLYCT